MELDDAQNLYGGFRRWHMTIFVLLGFSTFGPLCWQGLGIVFIGFEPPHQCSIDYEALDISLDTLDEWNVTAHQCFVEVQRRHDVINTTETECTHWEYNSTFLTIVSEWDLVCGNNYLAEMSQVIYQCVMIFGDLITSYAADKVGRKPIHIFAHALVVIFGSATGLSQSYISFVVLKAITGLASVSSRSTGLLLIMEMFGSEHRSVTGIGLEFQWVILYLLLPVLAFLLHNWRHLQVLLSLSSLLWMVYIWILPESPMWLVANGQYEKAELSLTKMAKRNGLRLNEPLLLSREKEKPNTDMQMTISEDGITATVQDVKVPQLKLIHLFTDKRLLIHGVISSLLWLANTGVYYGLILSTPSLAGDRFLNFAITGLVEIPANALALLAVHRFGRRIPTCVFHMIAGIPLGAVAFLPFRYKELTTALAMIAKFGISASFAVIVLYTRELFPTNLRATSSAIITTLGGVGTVIAPFAAYAATKTSLSWLPSITFAALSVICGLLSLVLPETAGRPMPQTLEDIHALYR